MRTAKIEPDLRLKDLPQFLHIRWIFLNVLFKGAIEGLWELRFRKSRIVVHALYISGLDPVVRTLDNSCTIQRISIVVTNCSIHWIEIYEVDGAIYLRPGEGDLGSLRRQ